MGVADKYLVGCLVNIILPALASFAGLLAFMWWMNTFVVDPPIRDRNTPIAVPDGWATYHSDEIGFRVSYPADWRAEATPLPKASLRIQSPDGVPYVACSFTHERPPEAAGLNSDQWSLKHTAEGELAAQRARFQNVKKWKGGGEQFPYTVADYLDLTYSKPLPADPGVVYRGRFLHTFENRGPYRIHCEYRDGDEAAASQVQSIFETMELVDLFSGRPNPSKGPDYGDWAPEADDAG